MSLNKTAVLFFSRTLNDEYGTNSLGLNRKGFSKLYEFFVNKTLQTVEASGLPLVQSYSNEQVGETFSARLINALKTVADKGFEKVIVIGNDTPELSAHDISSAKASLDEGMNVIGKDARGGAYLIGVDLQHFNTADLEKIDWHSDSVCEQLSLALGEVCQLSSKRDVNQFMDLQALLALKSGLSRGVHGFIRSLYAVSRSATANQVWFDFSVTTVLVDRGPPQAA